MLIFGVLKQNLGKAVKLNRFINMEPFYQDKLKVQNKLKLI